MVFPQPARAPDRGALRSTGRSLCRKGVGGSPGCLRMEENVTRRGHSSEWHHGIEDSHRMLPWSWTKAAVADVSFAAIHRSRTSTCGELSTRGDPASRGLLGSGGYPNNKPRTCLRRFAHCGNESAGWMPTHLYRPRSTSAIPSAPARKSPRRQDAITAAPP